MPLYHEYKIYGPYYHKRIDRNMICLVSPTHRTSMTYARYLMCLEQNRWLEDWEHVDHIDNNRLNDVIDNLQILTLVENSKKSAKGKTMITLVCPQCEQSFTRERRQVIHKKRKAQPCCSRTCAGKYQFYGAIPQPG